MKRNFEGYFRTRVIHNLWWSDRSPPSGLDVDEKVPNEKLRQMKILMDIQLLAIHQPHFGETSDETLVSVSVYGSLIII